MKVAVDTNVLVRAVLQDDEYQGRLASQLLRQASVIAVSLPCLCELVWVLRRAAKLSKDEVATTLRDLLAAENVVMNRSAVEAGIMAYEGFWLGGETFVSFDRKAVKLISEQGQIARLLGD